MEQTEKTINKQPKPDWDKVLSKLDGERLFKAALWLGAALFFGGIAYILLAFPHPERSTLVIALGGLGALMLSLGFLATSLMRFREGLGPWWSSRPSVAYRQELRRKRNAKKWKKKTEARRDELFGLLRRRSDLLKRVWEAEELLTGATVERVLGKVHSEGGPGWQGVDKFFVVKPSSPLYKWMRKWLKRDGKDTSDGIRYDYSLRRFSSGLTAGEAFDVARRHQLKEYARVRETLELTPALLLAMQQELDDLSASLGLPSGDVLSWFTRPAEAGATDGPVKARVEVGEEQTGRERLEALLRKIEEKRAEARALEGTIRADGEKLDALRSEIEKMLQEAVAFEGELLDEVNANAKGPYLKAGRVTRG